MNAPRERLAALDIFRGWTIAAMLVVNSPGHSGELSHAKWNGLHLADLIFPFFLFMVGVSIALTGRRPLPALLRRGAILFGLGLLLNLFMAHGAYVRVPGVLQRIGMVFVLVAWLAPRLDSRALLAAALACLLAYWAILCWVPGGAGGVLEPGQDIGSWLDRLLVPGQLRRLSWDPEGLLSTLPACASAMFGVLTGRLLRQPQALEQRLLALMVYGFGAAVAGYLWSFWLPFNKPLWTGSFVLTTSGLAMLGLASLCWCHARWGGLPLGLARIGTVFGTNATVAYLLHEVLETLLGWRLFGNPARSVWDGAQAGMAQWGLVGEPAALLYSAAFLAVCYQPMRVLYQRGIFIKI